jgi:hypothetical protein
MDLNPSLIKMFIKFSKIHLKNHSLKEEEEALYNGLSIILYLKFWYTKPLQKNYRYEMGVGFYMKYLFCYAKVSF